MFAGLQRDFDFGVGLFAQFAAPNSTAVDEVVAGDVASGGVHAGHARVVIGRLGRVHAVQTTILEDARAVIASGTRQGVANVRRRAHVIARDPDAPLEQEYEVLLLQDN